MPGNGPCARWEERAVPRGTLVSVNDRDHGPIMGGFAGIDADGVAQLRLADGRVLAFMPAMSIWWGAGTACCPGRCVMLLAVDVGNTNVVFALFEDGPSARAGAWPPIRAARPTNMRLAAAAHANPGFDRSAVRRIIISTVVPRALHNLQVLADKYFGLEAWWRGRATRHGASSPMSTSRARWAPTARST
jgi:hypothetical protein